MGNFRNTLRESDEYQTVAGQTEEAVDTAQEQSADTVAEAMAPIMGLEKGDAEFWLQVLMVVLLFLIYRELARANGNPALGSGVVA